MFRFLVVSFGQLLTLAATALMILTNIAQLTNNTVARHLYITSLSTRDLGASVGTTTGTLYAPNQAAAELSGQGLKFDYYWGLYRFCAGDGVSGDRDCSDSNIGFRYEPSNTLQSDSSGPVAQQIRTLVPDGKFNDDDYLGRLSRVANIIILVGTILTGLAFLTGFLAHRFCFALAALQCLGAAGCLAVGAAIWTAIIYKVRASIPDNAGISADYGYTLWFTWASLAAVTLAIVPLLLGCCVGGRSKY
ncbi:unnamed protein product [Jaminaea pallidilutea]